mgnify:CR=1 FL=1
MNLDDQRNEKGQVDLNNKGISVFATVAAKKLERSDPK